MIDTNTLERFIANTQLIKRKFIWQSVLSKRMAAFLYAQEGKTIDVEAIRHCHALIKEKTGIFSAFRGTAASCLGTLLALSPHPQEAFNATLKVYDLLKSVKFRASDFLVFAAYQIATRSTPSDYENAVTRARRFYDGMKANHFFYTGADDTIFAAMLALSGLDPVSGVARIEQFYNRFKGAFWDKNSVQTLAQIMVLADADESIAPRVFALRDALRAQKIKLDKTYTLPILGVLALLPVEIEAIVSDLVVVRSNLKAQKGFGSFFLTSQELLLFSASIIAGDYLENLKEGVLTATLSTTLTHIMLAQQAAMIAAISASTAASAAASSS